MARLPINATLTIDGIDGKISGIYDGWHRRYGRTTIEIVLNDDMSTHDFIDAIERYKKKRAIDMHGGCDECREREK